MEKFSFKENKGLVIGLAIGLAAVIASIVTYCAIYFSTPSYLLIKNNVNVSEFPTYGDDGKINRDKYYTLSDSILVSSSSEGEEGIIDDIYFSTSEFYKANSDYATFEINAHLDAIALVKDLDQKLMRSGEGISLIGVNKDGTESLIENAKYDIYPTKHVDFTFKLNINDDIEGVRFKLDAKIRDEEENFLSGITFDKDTFYFSVLGV